ncbi:MAG: ATP-binding protein [Candidatus Omnitrophica bacterium]|nr:ATP-binding protein [Candidatus Omnitrophota bacterium]
MIIQRDLLDRIKLFIKRNEFISIIGPRQSGKTVFLGILKEYLVNELKVKKHLIQGITFEDRKLLMEFERDPVLFVKSFMPKDTGQKFYLMIDEFQYAQGGGQKLKLIYDTLKGIKIIITGSSSLDIKANVGKYMVGRILNFNLFPFSFREYLSVFDKRLWAVYDENYKKVSAYMFTGKHAGIKRGKDLFYGELLREYEGYATWGGYPAVTLAKTDIERKKILSDIYNNYILKDIKTLLELATEKNLFLLSQYLATQIGNITVYQNLSRSSNLEYRSLKKHIAMLEETFIIRQIKPFFKNRQKELSKNPKIYFLDMGFRNNLMENMNALEKRSDAGAIIENACFIRLNELYESMNKINFWRTKAGAEVDFILHAENNIIPIEIKYSPFTQEKLSKSIVSFMGSFNPNHAIVLTKDYWGIMKKGKTKILFAPVYYL